MGPREPRTRASATGAIVALSVRFAGRAQARIEKVLLRSIRQHGAQAAARYQALITASIRLLRGTPTPPYSQPVRRVPGVRALHLRHAIRVLAAEDRVRNPRHLLLYRIGEDGALEVLGLAHDRMQLSRAAGRARREAEER